MVHPVRAVLASGVARSGSLSSCLAVVLAVSPSWPHGGSALRLAPGVVVSSSPVARLEEPAQPRLVNNDLKQILQQLVGENDTTII